MDCPEDTQPMDTQVWETLGYSRAGAATYRAGDPGHVDLLQAEYKPAAGSETTSDSREELQDAVDEDEPTFTQQHQPETVTSPAAFSPTTPGIFAGDRSTRPIDFLKSTSRTPAPNLAGMFKAAENVMGLTQLFDQTQARSSPGPGEAPVDHILERPSPAFQHPERALSDSPVAVRGLSNRSGGISAVTSTAGPREPKNYYVSLKESQELRARRKAQQNLMSSPEVEDAEDPLHDPERLRAEKRRHLAVRQEEARQDMRNLATPMLASANARKRRKLSSAATVIGIITPASRRKNHFNLLSDLPTDTVHTPASSDEENDYFDELSQEVIPRSSPKMHPKTPALSKKSLQQVPVSSATSTVKLAPRSIYRKPVDISSISDEGRQVIATQPDKGAGPADSPANASQAEKIADSQPTHDGESLPLGTTGPQSSHGSQEHTLLPETASLSSHIQDRAVTTGRVQTSSAGPGPPKDSDSESVSHNTEHSQSSSQLTELPSSPPPTEVAAAAAAEQRSTMASSRKKIRSHSSTRSSPKNKHPVGSDPDLMRTYQSSEPSQIFRVPNRINYAVPETSPAGLTPNDTSSAPESMPPRRHTRSSLVASTSLSQGRSASTKFHTARDVQLVSPSKAESRQPSTRSSTQSSQIVKIRNMEDFENSDDPNNVTGSLDIGLDVMNEDDVAFTVDTHTPAKRRNRKMYHSKKLPMAREMARETSPLGVHEIQHNPLPAIESDSEQGQDKPDDDIFETSTPVPMTNKKAVGSLKRIRKSRAKSIPPEQKADQPFEQVSREADVEIARPENYSVPDDDKTISNNIVTHTEADVEQVIPQADGNNSEVTDEIVPNRVYAAFKGEYDFYYPGTCIGVSGLHGHQSYQIKFDDGGDIIAKDLTVIRRLELHVGDMVKVTLKRVENSTWVVRGFSDVVSMRALDDTAEVPRTDVYGHANVILEAVRKSRAKAKSNPHPEELQIETVPIELTYITHDQWHQFDDRLFHIGPQGPLDNSRAGSHLQTLSVISLPNSPSSRKRRHTITTAGKTSVGNQHAIVPLAEETSGILSNMAFAISYSADADKASITRLILQNGGTVLKSGFDELFDTCYLSDLNERSHAHDARSASVNSIQLNASASTLGFVALIADKHSRREKYIQALALNIPCLHGRWISDSITADSVLPWLQYLLPAGESAYFDNAVRNRIMPPMPEAADCRLSEMVASRPAFLDNTNVLLIMGKGKAEERRRTHLFLTYALGAKTVLRVRDVDAAKLALQDGRQAWDWVYVEELAKQAVKTELLGTATAVPGRGKGKGKPASGRRQSARKSADGAGGAGPVADAKFKVVGDEFVIQSLIWGALLPGES